jgi:CheY-like chemotaxis protein
MTVEGPMATREQRVLIVDDDREIRGIVAGTLRRDGYTVVEAGDGPEALDVALRLVPDLVLLDMTLPGMDGVEVARQLKATPLLAAIPVVALSALTQETMQQRALAAGCTRYLTKPCPPAALRDAIAQTLAALPARGDAPV